MSSSFVSTRARRRSLTRLRTANVRWLALWRPQILNRSVIGEKPTRRASKPQLRYSDGGGHNDDECHVSKLMFGKEIHVCYAPPNWQTCRKQSM